MAPRDQKFVVKLIFIAILLLLAGLIFVATGFVQRWRGKKEIVTGESALKWSTRVMIGIGVLFFTAILVLFIADFFR